VGKTVPNRSDGQFVAWLGFDDEISLL